MFYDRFKSLCEANRVSCKKAVMDIGLSNSIATKWKKTGATPNGDTLLKIAAFFKISVEELLGEENKPAPDGGELTETQREAIELIMKMSDEQLNVFIATLKAARGE